MIKFSERNGFVPALANMIPGEITPALRNRLWNLVDGAIHGRNWDEITLALWHHFYKEPLDTRGELWNDFSGVTDWSKPLRTIRARFMDGAWYSVYDHIEFLLKGDFLSKDLVNGVLLEEQSAYRYIEGYIVEITDELEILEVEEAANSTDAFQMSSSHIRTSLALISSRPQPDFRNSIKESISAVESAAKVVAGEDSDTLGKALKKLGKKNLTDPALLDGYSKLYGWTSDAQGIRHSLMDLPTLGHSEAKFFLVSCSAFANYLKSLV